MLHYYPQISKHGTSASFTCILPGFLVRLHNPGPVPDPPPVMAGICSPAPGFSGLYPGLSKGSGRHSPPCCGCCFASKLCTPVSPASAGKSFGKVLMLLSSLGFLAMGSSPSTPVIPCGVPAPARAFGTPPRFSSSSLRRRTSS